MATDDPQSTDSQRSWWQRFRWPLLIGGVALATVGLLALLTGAATAAAGPQVDVGFGNGGIRQINGLTEGSPEPIFLALTAAGHVRYANFLVLPGAEASLLWREVEPGYQSQQAGTWRRRLRGVTCVNAEPALVPLRMIKDDDEIAFKIGRRGVDEGIVFGDDDGPFPQP